jgi:hypothetical protein
VRLRTAQALGDAEGGEDEISEDQYTRSTAVVFLAAQTE